MSGATDEELPPLGERSDHLSQAPRPARRHVAVAAGLALLVGLAAGFGLGTVLDDDGGGDRATRPEVKSGSNTSTPPTTVETLPEECVATMRSAQQTLALLDQGLRDLRDLNLSEVDRAAREVQQLRGNLDADVRRCLELMGR